MKNTALHQGTWLHRAWASSVSTCDATCKTNRSLSGSFSPNDNIALFADQYQVLQLFILPPGCSFSIQLHVAESTAMRLSLSDDPDDQVGLSFPLCLRSPLISLLFFLFLYCTVQLVGHELTLLLKYFFLIALQVAYSPTNGQCISDLQSQMWSMVLSKSGHRQTFPFLLHSHFRGLKRTAKTPTFQAAASFP